MVRVAAAYLSMLFGQPLGSGRELGGQGSKKDLGSGGKRRGSGGGWGLGRWIGISEGGQGSPKGVRVSGSQGSQRGGGLEGS